MSSSVGMIIPNIWKIKHVPNHQPEKKRGIHLAKISNDEIIRRCWMICTCPPHPLSYRLVSTFCSEDVDTEDLKSPISREIFEPAKIIHGTHIYIYTCIYIYVCMCVCQPLPLHDMLRTATTGPGNATRHVQRMCFWCVLDMTLLGKK